jgi:hypothetical protein
VDPESANKHPVSYFQELINNNLLELFAADSDPGSGAFLTLDPGWKI